MGLFIDITGQRYGRLTALAVVGRDANKRTLWRFRCDCGAEKEIDGAHVRYGKIVSCGCYLNSILSENAKKHLARFAGSNRSHGMSRTPVYAVWKTMHDRCRNPRNKDYKHYGALGVQVCERWAKFENFIADMGPRPDGLTLERNDPAGNYEPSNCRWATWAEQQRNKRAA